MKKNETKSNSVQQQLAALLPLVSDKSLAITDKQDDVWRARYVRTPIVTAKEKRQTG